MITSNENIGLRFFELFKNFYSLFYDRARNQTKSARKYRLFRKLARENRDASSKAAAPRYKLVPSLDDWYH